jgi:hypothetical protein
LAFGLPDGQPPWRLVHLGGSPVWRLVDPREKDLAFG